MHHHTQARYGWQRDNTIGSTPQENSLSDDWATFWRVHRLEFQLRLAQQHGASSRLIDRGMQLAEQTADFFTTWTPPASILHGDLWSGNWGADAQGRPVIFDPAVYFGDHETDLAMMTLFGHPGRSFFAQYHDVFPIDDGFAVRKTLYNLYHILNHFNLFGGGYAQQAEGMIAQLLGELSA
jgi:fructosamine-3-kinase